ncbi:hypothetical protein ACFQX6_21145 [Streptosporangium lutulentum]
MSGEDRQSQLAREHKERQARRAEQERPKTKRNALIGVVVAAVVVVGGLVAATTLMGEPARPSPTPPLRPLRAAPSKTCPPPRPPALRSTCPR